MDLTIEKPNQHQTRKRKWLCEFLSLVRLLHLLLLQQQLQFLSLLSPLPGYDLRSNLLAGNQIWLTASFSIISLKGFLKVFA